MISNCRWTSRQVSETLSTQNEGKDGYSALDSVNAGLPSGGFEQRGVVPPWPGPRQVTESWCKETKLPSCLLCWSLGLGKAVMFLSPFTLSVRETERETEVLFKYLIVLNIIFENLDVTIFETC